MNKSQRIYAAQHEVSKARASLNIAQANLCRANEKYEEASLYMSWAEQDTMFAEMFAKYAGIEYDKV